MYPSFIYSKSNYRWITDQQIKTITITIFQNNNFIFVKAEYFEFYCDECSCIHWWFSIGNLGDYTDIKYCVDFVFGIDWRVVSNIFVSLWVWGRKLSKKDQIETLCISWINKPLTPLKWQIIHIMAIPIIILLDLAPYQQQPPKLQS